MFQTTNQLFYVFFNVYGDGTYHNCEFFSLGYVLGFFGQATRHITRLMLGS